MIYKVYYQDNNSEPPVRENTKVLYIEAESVKEVREKLKDYSYNIEYIQLLEGPYLEYEKQSEGFTLKGDH